MTDSKFNLNVINWLFYVMDPAVNPHRLSHVSNTKEMLELILDKLVTARFVSESGLQEQAITLLKELRSHESNTVPTCFYLKVRQLIQESQWFALIIPSGIEPLSDGILCDPHLFEYVLNSNTNLKGLIFQLEELPLETFTVSNVYPALRTALNDVINWPGILLWQPGGDAVFLPVGSKDWIEIDIEARIVWVFNQLTSDHFFDFQKLKIDYKNEFPEVFENESSTVHILHLSDIGIGSHLASRRMPRLKAFITSLIEALGESCKIIPVITGNIMDSPRENHIELVARFWEFISNLGTEEPLLVLGKSDVRNDGNLNANYLTSIGFPTTKVVWHDDVKLGLVCINSVQQAKLDRGSIGATQLEEIEFELQRKKTDKFFLIALLHHHPIAHTNPKELTTAFYEKIIGHQFESILPLEDASLLMEFCHKHPVTAVLHGYGKIPLLDKTEEGTPIIGCGSSIGIVSETDGCIYFSINIVSVNSNTHKTTSRLLILRKPEVGLIDSAWHEMIFHTVKT